MIYIFLRVLFFYLLFRFVFRMISYLVHIILSRRKKYSKESTVNKDHNDGVRAANDSKTIIDAEFKEVE